MWVAYSPKELVTLMVSGPATWAVRRGPLGAGVVLGWALPVIAFVYLGSSARVGTVKARASAAMSRLKCMAVHCGAVL